MSQVIPFNQAALPAFLQQASGAANVNVQAATGTGGGHQVDHISIKGGRFHVVRNGQQPVTLQLFALNVVMVHVNPGITKAFFEGAWNPDAEAEAPICSSDDGVTPRADSDKPQCGSCAACPQNQFGSKINPQTQKQGKACMDKKSVAIVTPGAEGGEILRLQIPAASLKDFGAYLRSLPNVPYYGVVTEITFDTTVSFPKLLFKPVGYVSQEGYAIVEKRHHSDEAKATAGVAGATPMRSPAPQPAAQLPAPPAHMQQIPVQQIPVQPAQQYAQQQQAVAQVQGQAYVDPNTAMQGGAVQGASPQQYVQQQAPQDAGFGQPVQQAQVQQQVAPLSQTPVPTDPTLAAIFGGQAGGALAQAAVAPSVGSGTASMQQTAAGVNYHPSGREYGKPPVGKKRRTKAEMAEDVAVGIGATPGEQSEDDEMVQPQVAQQQVAQPGKTPEQLQLEAQLAALQAQLAAAQQTPAVQQDPVQQAPQDAGFGQAPQQAQPAYQQPANQPQVMAGAAVDAFAGWDD